MIRSAHGILLLLVAGLLFSGCVKRVSLPEWTSKIPPSEETLGPEEIFSLPEGEKISFGQLLNRLVEARVVFVGEGHDQVEHHAIQAKILREMADRGKSLAVGMEMFRKSQQPILDRWSRGGLTEEEFLKEINWDETWGMDYQLYKGILDTARERRLKIIGLNVEKELIRKVAQKGVEGLPHEDKARLPEVDLANKSHRAYLSFIYKGHHGGLAKEFEYFYQAQILRDEAMAESLADFLRAPEGEGQTVMVIAGNGHVVFDFGIPGRLHRRSPVPMESIVLKEWKKKINGDLTFTKTSSPPADFIWITKPNPPEVKRPRIGVLLQKQEGVPGLRVERVIPESPAEKAGILSGDQLIAVEGKEIEKVKDIHDALAEKGWGKALLFTILREGEKKEITVTLPKPEE